MAEMVKGFPKVQRALNLNDSISNWHDSEGNTGSILDQDEEAFEKTEAAILESYQAFLKARHG